MPGAFVDAYVRADDLEGVVADHALEEVLRDDANVLLRVLPEGVGPLSVGRLVAAADLAEHPDPRARAAALDLLADLRDAWQQASRTGR